MPTARKVTPRLAASSQALGLSAWTVRVEACGADYAVKDALRARGYRWNADLKVWWREVTADALTAEEFWLARHVYAPEYRSRAMGPRLVEVTARERYA